MINTDAMWMSVYVCCQSLYSLHSSSKWKGIHVRIFLKYTLFFRAVLSSQQTDRKVQKVTIYSSLQHTLSHIINIPYQSGTTAKIGESILVVVV